MLLDDKQRPTSWVALHEVLRAAPDTPLSSIDVPVPATLVAVMPLSGGLLHPAWRSSSVLPVTTRMGTFIGLLRHEHYNISAKNLAPRIAQQPLGCRIEIRDGAARSCGDDGFRQSLGKS